MTENSQRSILGKWALHRRWEAHVVFPGVGCLLIIVMYFFLPPPLQKFIAPGFMEVPLTDGRLLGIPHLAMALCLAWSLLLGWSTLFLTRDRVVWFISIVIMVAIVLTVMMWGDGHTLTSRASALWILTAGEEGRLSGILSEYQGLLGLAGFGLFTLVVFIILPLLYGDSRNPVVAMLIPSRWLSLTAFIMFVSFWVAFKLQGQGWDRVDGATGAIGGDLSIFTKPAFVYMLMLYMARLQYLTWVRTEAQHWNPAQRYR